MSDAPLPHNHHRSAAKFAGSGSSVNDRTAVVKVLTQLRHQLETNWASYRKRRDPDDPDLFHYDHAVHVHDKWLWLRFSVNDVRAEGYVFVEAESVQ